MNVRRLLAGFVFALSIVPSTLVVADGQKTVHVKPYTRKDGTHVAGHDRKAPEKRTSGATAAPASKNESKESSVQPGTSVARDEHGRIQRSDAARHAFARQT